VIERDRLLSCHGVSKSLFMKRTFGEVWNGNKLVFHIKHYWWSHKNFILDLEFPQVCLGLKYLGLNMGFISKLGISCKTSPIETWNYLMLKSMNFKRDDKYNKETESLKEWLLWWLCVHLYSAWYSRINSCVYLIICGIYTSQSHDLTS